MPALQEIKPQAILVRRRVLGISQAEVARRAGISRSYMSELEKGLKVPTKPVAELVAKALKTDLRSLVA